MRIEPGRIFVIGDSHIGLKDGDEAKMVAWIGRLERLAPRVLYLNGDLFHYYIGSPKFLTGSVERVFSRLRDLRDSGTPVFYVEGNRDFFLENSLASESVSGISMRAEFAAGSVRFLITHGDMINDRDLPYRFWRRASKNAISRLGVKMIPKRIARRFVEDVEKRLARSNFKHKARIPTELLEQFGRKSAAAGYDVVVIGHFHEKVIMPAGRATVAILPPWYETGEAMVIDPDSGAYEFSIV
jgi:UDP-2,3-diacylglucosamine hydrolase